MSTLSKNPKSVGRRARWLSGLLILTVALPMAASPAEARGGRRTVKIGRIRLAPPVQGRSLAEARKVLEHKHIAYDVVEVISSHAPGRVVAQQPHPYRPILPGERMTLFVRAGALPPYPAPDPGSQDQPEGPPGSLEEPASGEATARLGRGDATVRVYTKLVVNRRSVSRVFRFQVEGRETVQVIVRLHKTEAGRYLAAVNGLSITDARQRWGRWKSATTAKLALGGGQRLERETRDGTFTFSRDSRGYKVRIEVTEPLRLDLE